MATEATRCRILDAAEQLFAESGYAGASVRKITAAAQADLGAVRYHFGSKDGLFGAVMERRLGPLCAKRLALLDEAERGKGDASSALEDIIRAFLQPALELMSDANHGRYWIKLMGRVRIEPGGYLVAVQLPYRALLERFLLAFQRALPEVPSDELAYRFYFVFGAEINTLIDDGTLRAMRPGLPGVYEDPGGVVERLVAFCAAGLRGAQAGAATSRSPRERAASGAGSSDVEKRMS